jgi:nucleotide-binding universal stress UspA family protein
LPHADADGLVEVAPGAFNFRSSVGERALTRLETLRTDAGMDYCEITCTLAYGRPHERIIELASSARADLIVMGVHGRNRLDLALFGSTTNQVVRHATCPVLTLRH